MSAIVPQITEVVSSYDDETSNGKVKAVVDLDQNKTKSQIGNPNKGFEQEGDVNDIQIAVGPELAKSSSPCNSDRGNDVENSKNDMEEKKTNVTPLTKDEQRKLSTLREIVRICTHANPMKRPTSYDIVKILTGSSLFRKSGKPEGIIPDTRLD